MSYANSSRNFPNQPFYSPAKFESDQRDLYLSQLKAENFELRQNERDYQELAQHLKSLEHRYKMLHEEKMRNEVEFRNRGDQTLKTIANLRTEIDNLKSQLTDKHIENQELRAENLAFKEITEYRAAETQKSKGETQSLQEANRKLYDEKLRLEQEVQQQKDEKRRVLHEQEILNSNYEDLLDKLADREKAYTQLQMEFDQLEKQSSLQKQDVEKASLELKNKNENLKYTRLQYQEAQNYISQLQNDLEELHKQKEKFKQDSIMYQRNYQQEADTCMELNGQVIQLDQTTKHQEKTIGELRNEIERMKSIHLEALEQVEDLNNELDLTKRANESLTHQHQEGDNGGDREVADPGGAGGDGETAEAEGAEDEDGDGAEAADAIHVAHVQEILDEQEEVQHGQELHGSVSRKSIDNYQFMNINKTAQFSKVLESEESSVEEKYQAIFELRTINSEEAVARLKAGFEALNSAKGSRSCLLLHEVCYALGQIDLKYAPLVAGFLEHIIGDAAQFDVVRHEAAEALANVDQARALPIFEQYCSLPLIENDPLHILRDTCTIGLAKARSFKELEPLYGKAYLGTREPAAPFETMQEDPFTFILREETSLFEKYRALYFIRNNHKTYFQRVGELLLSDKVGALMKHEVCFVIGQVGEAPNNVHGALLQLIEDKGVAAIARHEALAAFQTVSTNAEETRRFLQKQCANEDQIVRETALVSLKMMDFYVQNI